MKQLMRLSDYREKCFVEGSQPSVSTLKRWIAAGDLIAEQKGGIWYVDIAAENASTGDSVVNEIMEASNDS